MPQDRVDVGLLPPCVLKILDPLFDPPFGVPSAGRAAGLGSRERLSGPRSAVKSFDGRQTRPNLYMLIGKESGSGGTSAFRLAFASVLGFQAMKRKEFATGLKPILKGERATREAEIEYLKRHARGKKRRRAQGNRRTNCRGSKETLQSSMGIFPSHVFQRVTPCRKG